MPTSLEVLWRRNLWQSRFAPMCQRNKSLSQAGALPCATKSAFGRAFAARTDDDPDPYGNSQNGFASTTSCTAMLPCGPAHHDGITIV